MVEKPILKKRKNSKPILQKRKERPFKKEIRRCQNVIDDGFYSGEMRICNRPVTPPNRFLCDICIRNAESEEQAIGILK